MAEWSEGEFEVIAQTCAYVISVARMSRDLEQLNAHTAPRDSPDQPSDH